MEISARTARLNVLDMIYAAQSSHIGSNFSCIDLIDTLFKRIDPVIDEFVCSKGWVAATVYYYLTSKGVIPEDALDRYCKEGEEEWIGLVEPKGVFGLRAAGGSVGYGLSFGVGFAKARKLARRPGQVYVLMSDGEMNTGMVWESAQVASHHQLNNLVAIVDYNKLQATGTTDQVLALGSLADKWRAFDWRVSEIDGHDPTAIDAALDRRYLSPHIIIAHTTKGKGVSFMENKLEWHYKNLSDEDYENAKQELCA